MTHAADERDERLATDLSNVQAFHGDDEKKPWEQVALGIFVAVPFVGRPGAIPIAWGWVARLDRPRPR